LILSGVGHRDAMHQHKFLVLSGEPDRIVLRIYNGNMICAPFSMTTKKVERDFLIIKVASDQNNELIEHLVGPFQQ
jgi:hypothetical protein